MQKLVGFCPSGQEDNEYPSLAQRFWLSKHQASLSSQPPLGVLGFPPDDPPSGVKLSSLQFPSSVIKQTEASWGSLPASVSANEIGADKSRCVDIGCVKFCEERSCGWKAWCVLDVCVKIKSLSTGDDTAQATELKLKYDMDISKALRIFIIISPLINFFPTTLIITNISAIVNRYFKLRTKIMSPFFLARFLHYE